MINRQHLLSIIALLFIVSGIAGLMYQIVWFKYLSLFLGNTTYAQTMVLASFMGGLALGAALWGKRADRSKNPLALYAWLELGIGVYCLLYPLLLDLVKSVFIGIVVRSDLPSDSSTVLFLKLLVSVVTLILPTMLMGGTLPVLVRFISHRIEESGKNVAVLYFLNSFGAVVGSLLGGFFFVPMVGLQATILSAVGINLVVGVVALVLSRARIEEVATEEPQTVEPTESFSDRQIRVAILVAGLSGFASMVYEVAWVRLLMPLLGSTTYSFTLMLVAFISGITLGSWIVSVVISRVKNLIAVLALCQFGVAVSMIISLPLYGRLPYYLWSAASVLSRTEGSYPLFLALQFILCFALMFVPTIFLGMSLPIASRIASRKIEMLGATVGNVFSVNTLGTVLGSLMAGLVLIPTIGIRHAIEVGVLINLALGLVILAADIRLPKARKLAYAVPVVAVSVVYLLSATGWNQTVMLMSIFRQIAFNTPPPPTYAAFEREASMKKVLYYREGSSATVAVAEVPTQGRVARALYVNGKVDASTHSDLPTQVLLGQYPMMLHPKVNDALVIGLGSGVTVGSILTHPVRSVDCVEISPEVVDASRFFDHVSNRPLEDARVRVIVDDALAYLKLTGKTYDVIVSEPSNPWIAGVGNLFTREFFQQCKERLNPGGWMVQWFHVYEMGDETFQLVVRTLRETFPHVVMWQSLNKDMILFASEEPIQLDEARVRAKFDLPSVRQDLQRIAIPDAATLFSLQLLSEETVSQYADFGPVNTENLPLLEYWAPRDLFLHRNPDILAQLDERHLLGGETLFLKTVLSRRALTDEELLNIGLLHALPDRGSPVLSYSMLSAYLKRHPKDLKALRSLVQVCDRLNREDESLLYLKKIIDLTPEDPHALVFYAWKKFSRNRSVASGTTPFDIQEYERLFRKSIELVADTVGTFRSQLGEMFFRVQRFSEAREEYQKALELLGSHPGEFDANEEHLRLRLAQTNWKLGNDARALQYAVEVTMINPRNQVARDLVYSIWMTINTQAK
ncbi:MAG TPA: fused MFS/spermidine synthase [Bacteroidota bacterium]|nr:fused MFS/spermidine synthase [Bacteroidota bacterium]